MNATKKSFIYWIASISRKWYPQITTLLSIRLTEKLLRVVIHPALGKKPEDFIETIIPYDGDLKIQINTGSFLEWQLFFHGYYEPEIINYVSKGNFRPIPKVDSAIIRLIPKKGNYAAEKENIFFKLIRTGFSGKRKQLAVNLATNFNIKKGFILEKLKKIGINPNIRAENLSIEQWQELLKLL